MAQRGAWNLVLAGLAAGPVQAGGVTLEAEGPGEHPGGHFLLLFTPESVRLRLRSKRTIPLTPGEWDLEVSFVFRSAGGDTPAALHISARCQNMTQADQTYLEELRLR